ncbi:hypothetical protein [Polyangium mundeleinium]|uniref:hypothetical protein n=1 Tax=Polyangium mundeleinium TaxID=2995306 RepID=UPI00358DB99D
MPRSSRRCPSRLITVHNLHLYGTLVREAREAILAGRYDAFAKEWLAGLEAGAAEAEPARAT